MGTVSFDYKINENGVWTSKHISHQPTLKTIFADGNGPLLDGKFTSMSGASYTYPYTGYAGTYGNSIIYYKEGTIDGVMTSLFGKGIGSGYRYFENNNTEDNEFIVEVELPTDDEQYPFVCMETDNTVVYVDNITHNTSGQYKGYIKSFLNGNHVFVPYLTNEELQELIYTIDVVVYDKTLNTRYDRILYCINAAGAACRFGAPDAKLIITGLFLEDFNPKYVCNSVNNSNYVNKLTDNNDMLQYGDGEAEYNSNPGTISCMMITYQTGMYTNNDGYNEYYTPCIIDGQPYDIHDVYANMYNSNSDFALKNDSADWPGVSKTLEYYYIGGVISGDYPSDTHYAYSTSYQYNLNYQNLYNLGLNALYDSDNNKYHIGNCIANYAVPEPQPELPDPEPVEDYTPEHNEQDTDYPIDPSEIPTPDPEVDNTVLSDINGFLNGDSSTSNLGNLPATDPVDGLNGKDLLWLNNAHGFDFTCYIGTEAQIASLRDDIQMMLGSGLNKALLLFSKDFKPSDVIDSVIELPFSSSYMATKINIIDSVPSVNNNPLCRQAATIDSTTYLDAIKACADYNTDVFARLITNYQLVLSQDVIVAGVGAVKWYKRALTRWVEIEYGTKTIRKIFGNYLDYEDVTYNLILPGNINITLDPNLLFRASDGSLIDACDLTIKGVLDIQTGDILINILSNSDLIQQITTNIAVTRSLNGTDQKAQTVAIAEGLAQIGMGLLQAGKIAPTSQAAMNGVTSRQRTTTNASGAVKNTMVEDQAYNSVLNRYATLKGATMIADGGLKLFDQFTSGAPQINYCQGQVSGSIKIISNQLPYLIINFPELIVPRQELSYFGPWDFNYKYEDEKGLPACTIKIGKGFNKYGSISDIYSNWTYSYTQFEMEMFKKSLLEGFYIFDEDNIYREPKYVYDTIFRIVKDNESFYLSSGTTDRCILHNFSEHYRRYVDRYLIGQPAMQGIPMEVLDLQVVDDQNIDRPTIKVSSEAWNFANEVVWNGRVYRIVSVDYNLAHYVTLHLEEDYITTWFYFTVVVGIIDRSSSYYITNIKDQLPSTVRRNILKIVYNNMESNLGNCFVARSSYQYTDNLT